MIKEHIFDISPEIETQTLNTWNAIVKNPMQYLAMRIDEYSRAPSIRPLFNTIIRGAVEGVGVKELHLAGAFTALDAVIFEHKKEERWFEINQQDQLRYKSFSDRFLADPRWHQAGLIKNGLVQDLERYQKLVAETGSLGPLVDITPLLSVLGGEHRLTNTIKKGADILVNANLSLIKSQEDKDEVINNFTKGRLS